MESRRQINRLSGQLDEAETTIWEMRELVTEHEAEIGNLNTWVWSLEDRCRRRGRRVEIRGQVCREVLLVLRLLRDPPLMGLDL